MKFWLHIHNSGVDQMLDIARIAEDCGYEGLVDGDHWGTPVDIKSKYPYSVDGSVPMGTTWVFADNCVAAGAVGAVTRKLKFGSSVNILPNRNNPITVAKAVTTAAIIGGNRFIFGVAAGWMKEEFDLAGIDFATRTRRMEEMIAVLRKLWGPGPVEHHGEFFDFDPIYSEPVPPAPIPIWIGGHSPAALLRAGRIGDGYMGTTVQLDAMPEMISILNQGRTEADDARRKAEFPIMLAVFAQLGENPDSMLPAYNRDNFKRMEDMGVTDTFVGPVPWLLGKPVSALDEKRRLIETLANDFIR
jgi:probable F420-dependent oxidoreductase